ncbi:GDSL-like Lipase/Acylhydrolase superfamily protein [Euphorbia peplus]|nr:GDSL-like Lipase/Acylhydrolase superfamily protein [Euphorbia peplus]
MEAEGLKYLIVGLVLGSIVSLSNSQEKTCNFPAIFNFGDSNSDTGGLNAAFGPLHLPYGQTFFGQPVGRYSDGRLMIDFMAEGIGLPYLSAYLDSMASNFSHGANFATAGSTIRPVETKTFSPFSLDIQFVQYSTFHNRAQAIINQGGVFALLMPPSDYFTRGMYTFDIGYNDIANGYFQKITIDQIKQIVPDMISQFSTAIKGVYANGGRSFWIHNVGPAGCYPFIYKQLPTPPEQIDKNGCSILYNDVPQYFNQLLKEVVVQLRKDLPLATITYVDMYTLKYTLITHAKELGFLDPFMPCCADGSSINTQPNALIWDGVHFTEKANEWLFLQFWNGSFSDPPTPFNLACP